MSINSDLSNLGIPISGIRRKAFNELNELVYNGNIKIIPVKNCFCDKTSFQILSHYDRYGLPFGTQICKNCGLISQTIQLSEDSLNIFYDKIYWPLNMDSEDSSNYYTVSTSVSDFINFIDPQIIFDKKEISIGEIGCGTGIRLDSLSNHLRNRYSVKLYGCDYSKDVLNNAKAKGIECFNGGMESLLSNAPYDILILSHLFEHLTDLDNALLNIDQLVHSDSLIYVEVPGIIDLENKVEYLYSYQYYNVLAHIHNFSLSTLSNIFFTSDFKLVKGTEFVRALYKKNYNSQQTVNKDAYLQIIEALERASKKHKGLMKRLNNPFRRYIKNVIKALMGRN